MPTLTVRRHPPSLLASLRDVGFVCPCCRGPLGVRGEAYRCAPCGRTYPLHAGIPDFRVFDDPYLSREADRERTEVVLEALDRLPLEPLLEHYWSHSDITPPPLRAKFVRNAVLGEERGRRMVGLLDRPRRVLDIGSGSGNFLIAAAGRFERVVGIDIGMRWLHLSRRRFRDRGLPDPPLVCCCAEHLPFADSEFDAAVCWSTLEFAREPDRVLAEAARSLTPDGSLTLNTANRYSVAVDPYSYLRGVGFLPRRWQASYVRWRRNSSYEQVRTLSLGELRTLAGRHFGRIRVALPDIDDASLRALPFLVRVQVQLYRVLKRLPLARGLLRRFGPQWDVRLEKRP